MKFSHSSALVFLSVMFAGFGMWALSTATRNVGNTAAETGFAQAAMTIIVGLLLGAALFAFMRRFRK